MCRIFDAVSASVSWKLIASVIDASTRDDATTCEAYTPFMSDSVPLEPHASLDDPSMLDSVPLEPHALPWAVRLICLCWLLFLERRKHAQWEEGGNPSTAPFMWSGAADTK